MAWIRYESGVLAHPKWQAIPATLRPDALTLHLACSSYAADMLTDGFVPADVLPVLAVKAGIRRRKMALAELVKVGLFDARERGVEVHDYLDYNPSAEEVKEKRRADAEKKKRAREANRRGKSPGDTAGDSPQDNHRDRPGDVPEGPSRDHAGAGSHPVPSNPSRGPRTESDYSAAAGSSERDAAAFTKTFERAGWNRTQIEQALIDPERAKAWIDYASQVATTNPGRYAWTCFDSGDSPPDAPAAEKPKDIRVAARNYVEGHGWDPEVMTHEAVLEEFDVLERKLGQALSADDRETLLGRWSEVRDDRREESTAAATVSGDQ